MPDATRSVVTLPAVGNGTDPQYRDPVIERHHTGGGSGYDGRRQLTEPPNLMGFAELARVSEVALPINRKLRTTGGAAP